MQPAQGDPSHALLAQLARGLVRCGRSRTERTLGDRSTYVGLSDVGQGIDCLRAAVARKVADRPLADPASLYREGRMDLIDALLRRELTLQRGHWFEDGIEAALCANGTPLLPQVEIDASSDGVPLKAHLDFVLLRGGSRPAVRVLELKSLKRIPAALYPSYEAQVYGQIGLLAEAWSRPVFSLRDRGGVPQFANLSFPDLVRRCLGLDLPETMTLVDLQGWVLAVSMTEADAFGPYHPDPTMLSLCRKTAKTIWETARAVRSGTMSLDAVAICPGFHILCDTCPFALDCPKFYGPMLADPALDRDLAELSGLKNKGQVLASEIAEREERIRQFCRLSGNRATWLKTGLYRVRNARIPGRRILDPVRLRSSLSTHLDPATVDAVIAAATTTGADYERLSISPIKPAEPRTLPA